MTDALKTSLAHWPEPSQSVFVPHSEDDYWRLVAVHNEHADEVGSDESHRLASLMEILGLLNGNYEDEHVPELETFNALQVEPPTV